MQNWVRAEFGAVDLGDGRREARLRTLVEQLSQQPEGSFGQACPTPADRQGAYRFFSNEAVAPEQILQAHFESSWGRMAGQPLVLVVQDTTSLDYSAHRNTQGLGPVTSAGQDLLVHSALALTYQARLRPDDCCEPVLSRLEWQVLYAHHHHRLPAQGEPSPTLGEALLWVAKLGGYWGRKADAPPGVKVVWRGLMRL